MSSQIDDGGPAFPAAPNPNYTDDAHLGQRGMTLRDVFAGQALIGFLSSPDSQVGQEARMHSDKAAMWAYEQADAMIAARKAPRQ